MKKIISLLLILVSQYAVATGSNFVYIEQIGTSNTNTITLEQVGSSNKIGGTNTTSTTISTTAPNIPGNITSLIPEAPSSTNYATINGNSNIVGITQSGDNNSAQYNIKGNFNTYTSTITGDNNQSKLTLGDVNTNNLRNTILEAISGNGNLSIQNLLGNDIYSSSSISGDNNQLTQWLHSNNGYSSNTISGSSNVYFTEQTDSGQHTLITAVTGDYNSITTQQQGANDTTINISIANGNNNTITVRSSSSSIVNPQTAIAR